MPAVTLAVLSSVAGAGSVQSLVIAIEGCVPSALQISLMAQSVGKDAGPINVICFWQHVAALGTMTFFLSFALSILV